LQAFRLLAIDAHQILRIVRRKAGEQSGQILSRIPLRHQGIRGIRNCLQRIPPQILQLKLKSSELSEPLHRRRIERNHERAGYAK